MFINETYSDLPKSQCDNCKNDDICKWKSEVIEVNTKISNLVFNKEIPIQINVCCKRFISKDNKREFY